MTQNNEKVLHLVVPARAEYLSLVRLVVAAVAKEAGFTEESVADIKVALSEASTNVVRHAYHDDGKTKEIIEITCYEYPGSMVLEVIDHGCGMPLPPPPSEGLGFGIMGSLMDNVDVETGKTGTTVLLEKSLSITRHA
ncbi:MAG: ATP-binding protein [Thermoleophilia bacterium]